MYGGSGTWPIASMRGVETRGTLDLQPQQTPAEVAALEHDGVDADARRAGDVLKEDAGTGLELLARVHERLPLAPASGLLVEEQSLDGPAARHAPAEQPRREHPAVVGDEQVAAIEQPWQIGHGRLVPGAGRAANDEQPRGAARSRLLRDL